VYGYLPSSIIFEKKWIRPKLDKEKKKVILLHIFVLLAITSIGTYNVGAATPKII
jgi:hypothetical protein